MDIPSLCDTDMCTPASDWQLENLGPRASVPRQWNVSDAGQKLCRVALCRGD